MSSSLKRPLAGLALIAMLGAGAMSIQPAVAQDSQPSVVLHKGKKPEAPPETARGQDQPAPDSAPPKQMRKKMPDPDHAAKPQKQAQKKKKPKKPNEIQTAPLANGS